MSYLSVNLKDNCIEVEPDANLNLSPPLSPPSSTISPSSGPPSVDWSKYVGLPYAPAGRSVNKDNGVDCWGLLCLIYQQELEIELPRFEKISFDAAKRLSESELLKYTNAELDWLPIIDNNVSPLDVIVIRIGMLPLHVGIVVDPLTGTMLNTRSALGESIIEPYRTYVWKNRIRGFYTHKQRYTL